MSKEDLGTGTPQTEGEVPAGEEKKEEKSEEGGVGTGQDRKKGEGPPADHPRFREIYAKMKGLERDLGSKNKDIESLKEHNKALRESMDTIEDHFDEANRPDPVDNPVEFADWVQKKTERDIKRNLESNRENKIDTSPATGVSISEDIKTQIIVQESLHDDYGEVVSSVQEEIDNDSALRHEIWSSPNPPAAAYAYGVKRKNSLLKGREDKLSRGYAEGGSAPPPADNGNKPTAEQERMANLLGVPIKNYMKQVEQINKKRKGA